MAKTLNQLKEEKAILEEQASQQQTIYENDNRRVNALKKSLALQEKILETENKIYKQGLTGQADILSLDKQIDALKESTIGKLNKKLGIDKQIQAMELLKANGTEEQVKNATKFNEVLLSVADGSMDLEALLRKMAVEDFGDMNNSAEKLAQMMKKNPGFTEQAKGMTDFKTGVDDIKDKLGMIDLKKTLSVAGIMAGLTKFVGKSLEIKQAYGTTALESGRIAGNITAASVTAKLFGGSAVEAEAAVKGMVEEFGTLNVVSLGTSISLGKMVATTGISGANAAKLLKSMESISTASIESNIALISSTAELARAAGVAPAKVMNDIASNTETFAEFAKDGGTNIAEAAIAAAKLGLNLSTVAGAAEKLLSFENSIEKQMEAQMLIGRSLNLDKARELALAGDLAGVAEEIKSQVGSQAEFEAMNVVQRKALADAMGLNVTDLGKMIAGEKTSAEMAEEKQKKESSHMDMQSMFMKAQIGMMGTQAVMQALAQRRAIATSVARIFGSYATVPFGLGLLAAGAAVGGMYSLMSSAPKAEAGGLVKEGGLAELHRGEVVSGTNNEMNMGTGETNKILKEMMAQNELLMRKLTGEVADMKLA